MTRSNQPGKLDDKITAVNNLIIGWINYYRYARMSKRLKDLDSWLRRKVRVVKPKQLKRRYTIVKFLFSRGFPEYQCWIFAMSGKGLWRKSRSPQLHYAMNLEWFNELQLESMYDRWFNLQSNS